MNRFIHSVDSFTNRSGKVISFLVFLMIFAVMFEAIARYVFNSPTNWAYELSGFLLLSYGILGGGYVLLHRAHVNVDLIYNRVTPRVRAIMDVVSYMFFFYFCGLILWHGGKFGWHSLMIWEHTMSDWGVVIWPAKLVIPVGAFLILLQGVVHFIRRLVFAISGREVP